MKVEIKILNKELYNNLDYVDAKTLEPIVDYYALPKYATERSAGIDLICPKDIILYPGERLDIHTGLAIWIGSKDYYNGSYTRYSDDYPLARVGGFVFPRSGLGKKGLILANTVGVIDEDYQGELIVSAWNNNTISIRDSIGYGIDIKLKKGQRFAQLVFMPVIEVQWDVVEEFSDKTGRGEGRHGSTGE